MWIFGLYWGSEKYSPEVWHYLSEDWELVNPIKQYEEVEVRQYVWIKSNGDKQLHDFPFAAPPTDGRLIEMTGTIKREIKPKVKHREEVGTIKK